jgi:hypothetical protein
MSRIRIADISVGDHVITHTNGLKEVTAKSSKISKIFEVKTAAGLIRASGSHRMWSYDTSDNEFKFVRVDEIEVGRHRLVRNKLADACIFMRVVSSCQVDECIVISCDDDLIMATPTHKFAVFDIDDQQFEMVQASDLVPDRHYLVLSSV